MTMTELAALAASCGFTASAPVRASDLRPDPQVRAMCADGACHKYGKVWSCPPACGTLAECEARIRCYHRGILVQTTARLEDDFDGETMMETEALHKQSFLHMHDALLTVCPDVLALGAGCCTRCQTCTYPDAPCRFPDRLFSSLEAYGILVSRLCNACGIPYSYGPLTVTYVSCFLFTKC